MTAQGQSPYPTIQGDERQRLEDRINFFQASFLEAITASAVRRHSQSQETGCKNQSATVVPFRKPL